MTVSFVASGNGSTAAHMSGEVIDYYLTTIDITNVLNDVVYFVYMSHGGGTTTTPPGWTRITNTTVGSFAPPSNPYQVEVWQYVGTGTSDFVTYSWQGNGSVVRSGFVTMRGVDTSYHVEVGSSYDSSPTEYWNFGAAAAGDAFLGFFWDDLPGGPGTFTYPATATAGTTFGWYRIGSQTASVPGSYQGTTDDPATYPGYSDPTVGITLSALATNVGASAGVATAAAVGTGIAPAVGASAGVATATGHSGVDGMSAGVATATAVGAATIAATGLAAGSSTVTSYNGLRQAVGLAVGTSTVVSMLPLAASRKTTLDHVQAAIDRLPEYAKEAAHA